MMAGSGLVDHQPIIEGLVMRVEKRGSRPVGEGEELCCLPPSAVRFPLFPQPSRAQGLENLLSARAEFVLVLEEVSATHQLVGELCDIETDTCKTLETIHIVTLDGLDAFARQGKTEAARQIIGKGERI
jgi:hypothetical protein